MQFMMITTWLDSSNNATKNQKNKICPIIIKKFYINN